MNYRRLRKKFDLKFILPEAKFISKKNKSGLISYVDNFSEKKLYKNHKLLSDEDELGLAISVSEKILVDNQNIQVWDIPKLLPDDREDNDSDDEPIQIENDFNIEMNNLRKRINISKQQTKVTVSQVPAKQNEEFLKEQELMRQSFYQRDKLFGVKIERTHLETDYARFQKSIDDRVEESEEDEEHSDSSMDHSYSEEQNDFPWYNVNDSDVSQLP